MKLYFLTTLDPYSPTGGALVRRGTIHYLRENGFDVVVVGPNNTRDEKKSHLTTHNLRMSKIDYSLEALGIVRDQYYYWQYDVYHRLKGIVNSEDILFVTTGGSMAPILVAEKLSKRKGCRVIVNFHDPVNFTTLFNGYGRENKYYHINRDRIEKKYIHKIDYIITSSEAYRDVLVHKYPEVSENSICNYFGYTIEKDLLPLRDSASDSINIVYGGNFGPSQSPEILAEASLGLNNVEAYFVGHYSGNQKLLRFRGEKNIHFINSMSQEAYFDFLQKNADIGFFSLRNNLSSFCVPSKLFDFINLCIPMVAIVKGDAKKIIESNSFGYVCDDSVSALRLMLSSISRTDLESIRANIVSKREQWSMSYRIKDVVRIINSLVQ